MTVDRRDADRVIVAQTAMALEDVRERSPEAGHVLSLCCFLAADDVPRRLLLSGAGELPDELGASLREALALVEAAATLADYGLIRVDGDAFGLHRRVQEMVRDGLGDDDRRFWAAAAARVVLSAFPARPEATAHWPWVKRLIPQMFTVIDHLEALDVEPLPRARMQERLARYLITQAQLALAEDLLETALAIIEMELPESALYASVLNRRAIVDREKGHFNAARRDARRALAMHKAALDKPKARYRLPRTEPQAGPQDAREGVASEFPTDPDIADDLQNLGIIARRRREFSEAYGYLMQAYTMRATLEDETSSELAQALIDLFNLWVDLGEYRTGIDLLTQAVEIQEAASGPRSFDAKVNRQLLEILEAQDGADQRAREILARHESELGPRHPQTADASRLLATLLGQMGEHDEARRMVQRALEIDSENYGRGHFRVGTGYVDLMSVEANAGNLDAAEECLRRVVDVVLAGPSVERVTILRLSDLDRRLAEIAVLDEGRPLVARAAVMLEKAFKDDSSLHDAARELIADAALVAGDSLLRAGRVHEARLQYDAGLRLALLTTDNPLDDADFHIRLGLLAVLSSDDDGAARSFADALGCLGAGGYESAIWPLLVQITRLYLMLERPRSLADAADALVDKAIKEGSVSMYRAEIEAPVPENWFTKASMTLLAPDGQANVITSSEPLDPSITNARFAEIQGDLLKEEFEGYEVQSFEDVTVFGNRQGYLRHFEWTPPDGVRVTQLQIYFVENARGYTATATTATSGFADRELVLREVLRGLRMA